MIQIGMMNRKSWILSSLTILMVVLAFGLIKPAAADNLITVTTTNDVIADDGLCSLREAVMNANSDLGGIIVGECAKGSSVETDIIQLTAGFTYQLTIAGGGEDAAATGDLDVKSEAFPDIDLIVRTIGDSGTAVIEANGIDRIFDIHGADFTLINIDVTGGTADVGGGLKNDNGNVVATNSSFTLNFAQSGGALHSKGNDASLRLTNTTISRNFSVPSTGAGIYNEAGLLVAIDSNISGNMAADGGGGLHNKDGSVVLTRTRFSANETDGCGGGINNKGVGVVTLIDSQITGVNKAGGNGGGICNAGTMSLTQGTLVYANRAQDDGGGIYNAGTLGIRNSRIENNVAAGNNANTGYGGGLYGANTGSSVDIRQSAIVGNQAEVGGGIKLQGNTTLLAFNSTISGNFGQFVGGMYVVGAAQATLMNVTMVDNMVSNPGSGDGLVLLNGTAVIGNSIIANVDSDIDSCGNNGGTLSSLGNNLGDDSSCFGESTDIVDSDPMLAALVDGVQSPEAGSPAIDAASALICSETAVSSTDQIGQSRPMFNGCDIGAIEWTGMQVYLPIIVK